MTPRKLDNGVTLLASFDYEPIDGILCRLTLVRSDRGTDMIWSRAAVGGPSVRIAPELQRDLALAVRAELASLAAGALAA